MPGRPICEHDESLLNKLNRSLQICITTDEAYPRINLIVQELFPDLSGGLSVFNKAANQMETVVQWGKEQLLPIIFSPMECFSIRESTAQLVEDPDKSVPCIHIDNFKKFNDTYSHLAGDEVLKLIGKSLQNGFRKTDMPFRFGGEEFVVILLQTTLDHAFNHKKKG